MKGFSSNQWRAMRARVAQAIDGGHLDAAEGGELLASTDAAISAAEKAEADEAHSVAHRKRQAQLAAQGERASRAAYRRIGREPPPVEIDKAAMTLAQGMAGESPRPTGVPAPEILDYFRERRAIGLEAIEKLRSVVGSRA